MNNENPLSGDLSFERFIDAVMSKPSEIPEATKQSLVTMGQMVGYFYCGCVASGAEVTMSASMAMQWYDRVMAKGQKEE